MKPNKKIAALNLGKKSISNLNQTDMKLIIGGKTKPFTENTDITSMGDNCATSRCTNTCDEHTL